MSATDLGITTAAEWLRLLLGLALLLMPGIAAVDRFVGLGKRGWMFAPVFSLTLLPLTAILLDLVVQAPVTPAMTMLYAILWSGLLEWPRRKQAWSFLRRWVKAPSLSWRPRLDRKALVHGGLVLLVLAGVAVVQSLPHLPGEEATAWSAYPRLAVRTFDGLSGDDYPYPVHVDEHYHLAHQAAIEREGHIDILDPYTGQPYASPLFSVQGFRDERGFDLALVQVHQLTGGGLATQAHFLPAIQAALLAGVLYAALAPAPGALASAALVAIIPTTVRFLGPAFLVPSAFSLPWIVTAMHVSLRSTGGRRLAAIALLETGAFFLHLVLGTLVLATAAGSSLARPGRLTDRLTLAAVCFLPLLWIGPLVTDQVTTAVAQENELPFQPAILLAGGVMAVLGALVGGALAFLRADDALRPHRVLAGLGLAVTASLFISIEVGHHSDATYSRLVPTFLLCVAGLAGLALGALANLARRLRQSAAAVPALLALLVLIVAAPAVGNQLSTPYYRVFDADDWDAARVLEDAGLGPDDGLLCDPWLGPIYNMATGAIPRTVLTPGNAPPRAEDWSHYLASDGANETWLADRGIDVIVAPMPPNAPHVDLGAHVYRLTSVNGTTPASA
jgi:hypothetical protein